MENNGENMHVDIGPLHTWVKSWANCPTRPLAQLFPRVGGWVFVRIIFTSQGPKENICHDILLTRYSLNSIAWRNSHKKIHSTQEETA